MSLLMMDTLASDEELDSDSSDDVIGDSGLPFWDELGDGFEWDLAAIRMDLDAGDLAILWAFALKLACALGRKLSHG
ncbi:hypothetical protein PISMIDRAFT_17665 [Pisolithus microcarpus 441]|uniref:Uncharacterized protein n=1 Tax=Pisolithus microcarpus 441 TaxID=765257 RepID=A0A0C9YAN1_9AGAM|nr:hypothetical protein PISMIDRAFT_17665 [Pisolithus microcarpus 441]